tara:strand:- start:768 stop:1016 length:249 start_codon:yes stop_codon:yes gene_type:complete
LTDKEILTIIKAAMIMLNTYLDLMGSAELLEYATTKSSRDKVEDLVLELAEAHLGSRKEIILCKAEMLLSRMRGPQGLNEVN